MKTDKNTFEYLYEIFDETELSDRYKKYKGNTKYLADVKTADGKPAPAIAVLAAVVPYIDAAAGISHWRDYKLTEILPECDKASKLLDRDSLTEFIKRNADIAKNTDWLYPYCRYASEKETEELCALRKKNKTLPKEIYYTQKLPLGALMLSDTKGAVSRLHYAGYYFRDPPLNDYAKMRGVSYDNIVDEIFPDIGLNEKGEREFDLGTFKVRAILTPELKLSLYNEKTGKYVKSVPKRGTDPEKYEAALSEYTELKFMLRLVRKTKTDILFERFLDAREWNFGDWSKAYLENPLNREISKYLVWEQGGNTFLIKDKKPTDSSGTKIILTNAPIKSAHPMEMKKADLEAWKKYLSHNDIKQPFKQIWEPVRDPETLKENRYAGIQLPSVYFLNQQKHGISGNVHMRTVHLSFSDCVIRYIIINSVQNTYNEVNLHSFKFDKYTRRANHIVAFLDLRTLVGRVIRDDMSAVDTLQESNDVFLKRYTDIAIKHGAKNLTAKLLEMKKERFPEYDGMDEFTLGDWDEE